MYAAGRIPDHVTRYNHKSTDRWLTPPVQRGFDWRMLSNIILLGISVACIIVSGVMILQGI